VVRISVALATFNGEIWLKPLLASIAAQTRRPDELVVSDDASTDATLSIVQEFALGSAFPIVLIQNSSRAGYSANFGRALEGCKGDVVFLADQDDEWLPNKIETMAAAMGGASLGFHDAEFIDRHGVVHGPTMFERLRMAGRSPDWAVKGCCTVVSRSLLRRALPLPASPAHDAWLHQLSKDSGDRVIVNEPLLRYRIHGGNTSTSPLNRLEPPDMAIGARARRRLVRVGYRVVRSLRSE
jgi:glycosyltransferase involved in cell wall biosynthesis